MDMNGNGVRERVVISSGASCIVLICELVQRGTERWKKTCLRHGIAKGKVEGSDRRTPVLDGAAELCVSAFQGCWASRLWNLGVELLVVSRLQHCGSLTCRHRHVGRGQVALMWRKKWCVVPDADVLALQSFGTTAARVQF